MTIYSLLGRIESRRARGWSGRIAFWVAVSGSLAVGVVLFLLRLGVDLPGLALPGMDLDASASRRLFEFLAVSVAGLLQGAALIAVVLLVAFVIRWFAAPLLRRVPARTARDLDTRMETDRYSAALEARGPLATLVVRGAVAQAPPWNTLAPRGSRRARAWMLRFAVLLALAVALVPGTDASTRGEAPTGPGRQGQNEEPMVLRLNSARATFPTGAPVPVEVVVETRTDLARDFQEEVILVLDEQRTLKTNVRVILAAGGLDQDSVLLDLRKLAEGLKPGPHIAVAKAGPLVSNVYEFTIDPGTGGGGGGGAQDKREAGKKPRPNQGDGGGGGGNKNLKPKFIEPLVRDGEKVKKRARVLQEGKGGGKPVERTLDEAWPELQRRKEAALKRPGLSPAARTLVREYFDRLEPASAKPAPAPAKKGQK